MAAPRTSRIPNAIASNDPQSGNVTNIVIIVKITVRPKTMKFMKKAGTIIRMFQMVHVPQNNKVNGQNITFKSHCTGNGTRYVTGQKFQIIDTSWEWKLCARVESN